eukprot:EC714063.1.p1 GENE.EC714063.1~~EC714063.1.p1  ORF type:complete len:80 (+),score=1.06 EC714063.1:29-268(+)
MVSAFALPGSVKAPSRSVSPVHRRLQLLREQNYLETQKVQDTIELPVVFERLTPRSRRGSVYSDASSTAGLSPRPVRPM